ncbi:MAG TPA: GntR family transcriptional regulator [Gemmatimonadota bacterium]|nr:GntR family transcriptional regulator [Gemmatimonadota bacterium]
MKHGFTDRVRKALAMAREEAIRHRHGNVGAEHLLLGLLRLGDPGVVEVLARRGVGPESLREAVLDRMRPGQAAVEPTKLPYTADAKRVLELAMRAARRGMADDGAAGRRRGQKVDVLELLEGLVAEERSPAAVALAEAGLTVDVFSGSSETAGVVIDDASDRSIYEQIVARIQERIAVGELEPGERLPTVRRMADHLDLAPGTVARAYGELERLGLVETRGAGGTRVAERSRAVVPDEERRSTLAGLLRPVAVAAFHLGATAGELRSALETAMADIFE